MLSTFESIDDIEAYTCLHSQNPPTKGCSFHIDEEDDDVVQQTPDIQISNNENDFDNETTCSEELHQ